MTDTPDHTPAEDDLLAVSAILDGTATVEERARVESDPDLQALYEELRTLRDELGAPPPVDDDTRDRAVAAAMAVFDELHTSAPAGRSTVPVAPDTAHADRVARVVRLERRRRWYGVVTGAAAAAVAVLFVGAIVMGGIGGGDDEESASFSTEAAAKAETRMESAADATTAGAADAATADAPAAAEVFGPSGGADVEASEATEAPAATMAAAADTTAPTEDTIDSIDGAAGVTLIDDPAELAGWARDQRVVLPLPGLELPCVGEGDEPLGEVTYQGTLVIVVRDPDTGTLTGYDQQDACTVVVSVDPAP